MLKCSVESVNYDSYFLLQHWNVEVGMQASLSALFLYPNPVIRVGLTVP